MIRLLALFLLFWLAAATDHGPHKPTTALFQYVPPCLCLLRIIFMSLRVSVPPCMSLRVCPSMYIPFVCMSLRVYIPPWVYVPPCVGPSMCMSPLYHVYVSPCICPSECLSLGVYVPSVSCECPSVSILPNICPSMCMSPQCVCPVRVMYMSFRVCVFPYVCFSGCMSLQLYVLSVCISPPCHVYVPFVCMSRRVYVPSVCISFHVYVPSFVCALSVIMHMSRRVYVPPCVHFTVSTDQRCVFHHVYVLSVIIRDKRREGRFGRLFV